MNITISIIMLNYDNYLYLKYLKNVISKMQFAFFNRNHYFGT